jgi:RHS repeat-associated protein
VSGTVSATFVYDGDGNRVKSIIGTTNTVYIGGYFEWSGSSSTMRRYYYAGGQRVAMRLGTTTLRFLLGDHLGSTAITATTSGSKLAELRYYPWGGVRYSYGTTPTDYRFTGQQEIATIGLYFYNSRFYDAALGRFISPDTVIPDMGNPLDFDRYGYVRNNPLKYSDPTGHILEGTCLSDGYCGDLLPGPELDVVQYWKDQIMERFGITMSDDRRKWTSELLASIYNGLLRMDRLLYGELASLVGGSTYYLDSHPTGYEGWTEGKTIIFYTLKTIPNQNQYHEFGHLLDNVLEDAITNLLGSQAYYQDGKYLFGGERVSEINIRLTLVNRLLYDPNWPNGIIALQHPDTMPGEQWADIWANYVAGNIDLTQPGGRRMDAWIRFVLHDLLVIPHSPAPISK